MGRGFGVVTAALAIIFLCACSPPETKEERLARMKASCQQQYGDQGELAVNQCTLKLLTEALDQQEADKMDRARQGAN